MDSYLIWKLTGGRLHITDVTNASRTLLMSLRDLKWDEGILEELRYVRVQRALILRGMYETFMCTCHYHT